MSIEFFTRLPLHGETQFLPGDPRNRGDWHAGGPSTGAVSGFAVGDHFTYIDYLGQIARAAEINGFGGALMVNAPTGEEPWTVCSLLARETRTLKFVTAFQPYHYTPWVAVQQAATYQRATGNRLVWNIINGGSDAIQRQVGDFEDHDQRYARATEFMDVVRGYWHHEQFHYQGTYYRAEGGGLRGPLKKAELPLICTAGSSVAAREFAAKHADFYLMRAEHPDEIAALIADIRARALKWGRTDIRFGLSIDVIARETEDAALAEAKRFFDEGVAKGTVKARAAHAGLRTARKLSYEHDYNDKDEQQAFDDFFIHPNVWTGFGYIGIPPGCALVGSYANVVARIREYHGIGVDLFFLAGYPHLEEAYRIGEHILPHFREQRAALARPVAEPVPLHASNGA
ncbi:MULTISPECIES: LLM class flavin-dependent oxidoreductase [unclassified Pseudomonas]|uniref:LLM class flavin-dependent oxidoreductase n=1 Tax=unclassified Pseudomonas TaxID=196821 RepID=UPI000C885771|nr:MULTISPECIES: LLM class flavin-dependent oxidoreductase [unclassified Pseudomonas]PMZ90287.1 LLM class flavin-dependent oxidoreductase [Pseudomonas sp. FW305-42]PNA25982.1 LLM class flavin-dependent oxidoreductase [Pseudomonas sp. MPR-R1B]PNB27908.1 LLM class flavin-dependent oxidoreductase [Pseudomonas sp. DP16D-E2]PNB44836.1 LLM class flavin-dependent oxidoreductase [Pseudomonas sp. FW305-17]PNB63915.1 LLM class flavin-dependent oxidoreductase [Pseudomonas sp. GW531-E2]